MPSETGKSELENVTRADGGPAFPVMVNQINGPLGEVSEIELAAEGMSLRDYFAAHNTLTAHRILVEMSLETLLKYADADTDKKKVIPFPRCVAKMCYDIADAMLAARQNGGAS